MAPQNLSGIDANTLPNPYTPLAFVPPSLAFQASLAVYVMVCCLAVILWDILHTLSADYKMAFKQRFTITTFVYFVSRYSTLGYITGKSVQLTAELPNCHLFETIMCALYTMAHGSTSILLYFRVCAVYNNHPAVRIFFALTWLTVIGGAVTTFGGIVGAPIGPTRYCTSLVTGEYIVATSLADVVNATLVFLAIMWRLSSSVVDRVNGSLETDRKFWASGGVATESNTETSSSSSNMRRIDWRAMKLLKRPVSLQRLTDVFLQDSQILYLIVVVINFLNIITYFTVQPAVSPLRIVIIFPDTTIVNIMACRVYRNMKIGRPGILPAPTTADTLAGGVVNYNGVGGPRNELTEPVYRLGRGPGKEKGGVGLIALESEIMPPDSRNEFIHLEECGLSRVNSNTKGSHAE